jgi:Rieske Fe-S protein
LDLRCPNHGSGFRADDGAVLNGPATRALDELSATIEGDDIVIA